MEYDAVLRDYYVQKKKEENQFKELRLAEMRAGNNAKGLQKYISRLRKPKTFGSTLMEAGGSGPIGDGEMRSQDSDMRHLLSFLFDVTKLDENQLILQQMRWVDHLGLLYEKTS